MEVSVVVNVDKGQKLGVTPPRIRSPTILLADRVVYTAMTLSTIRENGADGSWLWPQLTKKYSIAADPWIINLSQLAPHFDALKGHEGEKIREIAKNPAAFGAVRLSALPGEEPVVDSPARVQAPINSGAAVPLPSTLFEPWPHPTQTKTSGNFRDVDSVVTPQTFATILRGEELPQETSPPPLLDQFLLLLGAIALSLVIGIGLRQISNY